MRSVICVHERFERHWSFTADYWHHRWQEEGGSELYRSEDPDARITELVPDPAEVQRLVILGFPAESEDLTPFTILEECYWDDSWSGVSSSGIEEAETRGVNFLYVREPPYGDVQWGQSVAEFALGLTICGLRRIPQIYNDMIKSHETWDYSAPGTDLGKPGQRSQQMGDDTRFTNGTIGGKRVRIVGMGNIGARYATWCAALGADVAVWDPIAKDATFNIAGARRCFDKLELVKDAEIFVPMMPLFDATRGIVNADMIDALPTGCLVIAVTRAQICDCDALYRRVLNDELSMAADVFDVEPVPLDSHLLGRHNVVHTPHNAGRTIDANRTRADDAIARFRHR
jgi:phosphoglycerate dehydrogenase-like enzyme